MHKTPTSLQNCSLDFICDNLSALCEVRPTTSVDTKQIKMVFKDSQACFNTNLSDQLLSTLSDKGKLNDETLSLFDPNVTNLRHVSIRNALVTRRGLHILKDHKISKLVVTGIKAVTVDDIIGCLGEWTVSNLRILNVARNTFLNHSKLCVVVSLSKLRNLHTLNVSFTDFQQHGLEIIAEELPLLEVLDISCTEINDISPLKKCRNRLRSLSIYNLRLHCGSDPIGIVSELSQLVHLDVSNNGVKNPINTQATTEHFSIPKYLSHPKANPNLISLDVSGAPDVAPAVIREFLKNHTKMNFIGLALTPICEYEMFQADSLWYKSHQGFKISGGASQEQIMESLQRYLPRSHYLQNTLSVLSRLLCQDTTKAREDIIKLVLPAMKSHPKILSVQISAIACLISFIRGQAVSKRHPVLLAKCVDLILTAMENFPNHQQLQNEALSAIFYGCQGGILGDVKFDRIRCSLILMECMCQFNNPSMKQMSGAVCSILAREISPDQKNILGSNAHYMNKLLKLVEDRLLIKDLDLNLHFALAILYSLTDEAPSTCKVFLKQGGLELIIKLLQLMEDGQFYDREVFERKILGLLNNVAEVKTLRSQLLRKDLIVLIKQRLYRKPIEMTFFAAGILAHLCSEGDAAWRAIPGLGRFDILEDLQNVVSQWDEQGSEMAAYRSFSPFLSLLQTTDTPIQLWAAWAIHNACSNKGQIYLPLLESEGGPDIIRKLMQQCDPHVREICNDIISMLEKHKGKPPTELGES